MYQILVKQMGITEVKKELKNLEKDKLIEMIMEMYKKNISAKDYFTFYANPDDKELFLKYSKKVQDAFKISRKGSYSLKAGKDAISEFKKSGAPLKQVAELTLLYVESGVKLTSEYGDIDGPFYSSMITTFASACELIYKSNSQEEFFPRIKFMFQNLPERGWGFTDEMDDMYYHYFSDYID